MSVRRDKQCKNLYINQFILFESMENWNNGIMEDLSKNLTSGPPLLTSSSSASLQFHYSNLPTSH